jgi:DeoR family transcriptional regulator of aga operon
MRELGAAMTSFKARERQQRIIEQLNTSGKIEIGEMARQLEVSAVTLRADLEELERLQVLRRIRGGAIALRPSRFERSIETSLKTMTEEKARIAQIAAALVHDNQTVIMDTGSTTAAIARALPKTLHNVAVVTNSLNIVFELRRHPGIMLIVTGGQLRPLLNSLVSSFGQLLLQEINADIAFMSCSGVDSRKGFTNGDWEEAEMKKHMLRAARRVIFVADHSKLNQIATARIAAISDADLLITDAAAPMEIVNELRAARLSVNLA